MVSGAEATAFLQGLLTNDVEHLAEGEARHAALLTPQGKILFDVMVIRTEEGYLLDAGRALTPDLAKRLGFYRLRSKVEIADLSADHVVAALWGEAVSMPHEVLVTDPRLPRLGQRAVLPATEAEGLLAGTGATLVPFEAYHDHRIALAVPEGGKDFALGDTFPHEANMDQLNGLDFKKGCYVGQEIVSRMQHKTTVRKRVVPVTVPGVRLIDGAEVTMGEIVIGYMGSSSRAQGLAMLRLDRVADALTSGTPLMAGGFEIKALKPAWATFDVPGAS
jgi:folate-binding protein YgfZ